MIKNRILAVAALVLMMGVVSPLSAQAQNTSVSFGGFQLDSDEPVEITADELSVNQETGFAEFLGNVKISQGVMTISAERVQVIYDAQSSQGVRELKAFGGVVFANGVEAAESETAVYQVQDGTLQMAGNVLLTQGPTALSAERMVVNLSTGQADMSGGVKTILKTGDN